MSDWFTRVEKPKVKRPEQCPGYDAMEILLKGIVNHQPATIRLEGLGAGDITVLEPVSKPIYRGHWHKFKCWLGLENPTYWEVTQRFLVKPCPLHPRG